MLDKIKNIKNKDDFLVFLDELIRDYENEPWHNNNISGYLDGIVTFTINLDVFYEKQEITFPPEPDWRMVAYIFMAAGYM
jgi:hypothetical protein